MKKIIYTLLTIITFSCISINANAYVSIISENTTCGKWVENRLNNNAADEKIFLLGFLSGLAMGIQKDFLKYVDASAVFIWTDNYCKANPTDGLIRAGIMFKNEMIKKNGL